MSAATDAHPRALAPPSTAPKFAETSGELKLRCIGCGDQVSAREKVMFWPGLGVIAHIFCALEARSQGRS